MFELCFSDETSNDTKIQMMAKLRQNRTGRDTFSQDWFADLRIGPLFDLYMKSKEELKEYLVQSGQDYQLEKVAKFTHIKYL